MKETLEKRKTEMEVKIRDSASKLQQMNQAVMGLNQQIIQDQGRLMEINDLLNLEDV